MRGSMRTRETASGVGVMDADAGVSPGCADNTLSVWPLVEMVTERAVVESPMRMVGSASSRVKAKLSRGGWGDGSGAAGVVASVPTRRGRVASVCAGANACASRTNAADNAINLFSLYGRVDIERKLHFRRRGLRLDSAFPLAAPSYYYNSARALESTCKEQPHRKIPILFSTISFCYYFSMSNEETTQNLTNFEKRVLSALASVEQRLTSVEQRLTSLEEQAERKALETKPIWERALNEMVELRQEMRDGFEDVEGKIGVLNQDVLRLRSLELRQRKFDPGAN